MGKGDKDIFSCKDAALQVLMSVCGQFEIWPHFKVLQGYTRLHKVTQGYTRLHKVTQGYTRLHKVTQGYTRLLKITQGAQRSSKIPISSIANVIIVSAQKFGFLGYSHLVLTQGSELGDCLERGLGFGLELDNLINQ